MNKNTVKSETVTSTKLIYNYSTEFRPPLLFPIRTGSDEFSSLRFV